MLRGLVSALAGAALLATSIGPGVAIASGTAPTVPDVYVTTAEDTPVSGNVLTNATDPEGDTLGIISHSQFPTSFGTITYTSSAGDFIFTPAANANGSSTAWFFASDGTTPVQATVHLTITPVNDPPVCASPVTSSGNEDTQQTGTVHCTDIDSGALTYALVDQAVHGTAAVSADGSWTYSPDANLNGADSFTFKANDGSADSNVATMNVTVNPVNDPPVAVADTGTMGENQAAQLFDVLANDHDPDPADTLTLVSAAVSPAAGTAGIVSGKVQYAPATGFTRDAVITYVITDGALTADATLTVTVTADVTAPVVAVPGVAFGNGRVNETAPIRISWSATDGQTGVAQYHVQASVAGGAWTTIYSGGVTTSMTKSYAFGKTLVFRVRAQDRAGNWSGWTSSPTRRILAYQAPGSSRIAYTGTWTTVLQTTSSGVGYRYVRTAGSRATLSFSGRSVLFVTPRNRYGGYVKVYVDGHYLGRYSEYRSVSVVGQILARASWSTNGTHTIRIVDAQAGRRMMLDAFVVLQ
jgi:VCBS repeat-containing protein